jgi:sulfate adenylyltransferase subunit 2
MSYRLSHLEALEAESIFILREVAAEFQRPVLLFSGGKDSICMLRLAEKAFRPARFPFPLMHIDTGHNFPELIDFRDRRASELGEKLIVRTVEDALSQGHRPRRPRRVQPQPTANPHPAGRPGGIQVRLRHRGRPPRRGKGPRQGAHLLLPRRLRPVGSQEPAPGAVVALQRAHQPRRTHARVPAQQLDRAGCLAVHRQRKAGNSLHLFQPPARGGAARRPVAAGQPPAPAQAARGGQTLGVRVRTIGDITCTGCVESPAATVPQIIEKSPRPRSPNAAAGPTTNAPTPPWKTANARAISNHRWTRMHTLCWLTPET